MKSLLLFIFLFLLGCGEPPTPSTTPAPVAQQQESEAFRKGKRQLETMGYKNIVEKSYPLFCCDKDDSFFLSTGFEATDASGEKVSGCFCVKGLIRNSVTIRFE